MFGDIVMYYKFWQDELYVRTRSVHFGSDLLANFIRSVYTISQFGGLAAATARGAAAMKPGT